MDKNLRCVNCPSDEKFTHTEDYYYGTYNKDEIMFYEIYINGEYKGTVIRNCEYEYLKMLVDEKGVKLKKTDEIEFRLVIKE